MTRVHNVPSAIFAEFLTLLKEYRGVFLQKICGEVTHRIHHILLQDELQLRGSPQEMEVEQLQQEAFDSPALLRVCDLIHREEGQEGGNAEDKGAEPAGSNSGGAHALIQAIEAPTSSEVQAETIEGSTFLQDKRKALHHETASVNQAGNSAIPDIVVTAAREEGSDTAAVSQDAAM